MSNTISVIVPVYNVERYLRDCLDSVLGQTYTNLEIILVDDGSTDGSSALCDEYGRLDRRVHVIHKVNGGLSSARNAGLDVATGELIGFIDSDDWVEPQMYELLYKGMNETFADVSVCGVTKIYPTSEKAQNFPRRRIYSRRKALFELVNSQDLESFAWNKLYKRGLFDEVRFPEGRIFEDLITLPKLFNQVGRVVHLNECLYNYRRNDESILGTWAIDVQAEFTYAQQDRFEYLEPLWPDFSSLMIERYAWSLKDLCKKALQASSDEMGRVSQLLTKKLLPFYREHRAALEPYTTEAARKKYDVLLGHPLAFAATWPMVRRIRTGVYNLRH